MYLSRLELHGFKSFADRTVVNFAPGVTVVVGPNGCGKSNVVDAVRWVIGEQRARILRSEKMENVIFNGAGHRKALGVAEVMLTIENNRGVLPTEYNEVTVGRRLYRSGESEYLLNGTQCRLKDITDLFMDTGMGAGAYSVIELKMIEELLSDNALDRRRLFEEAAGITKYKIRRAQTLRKLEGTQVDLTRVRDLSDELGRRVNSLERQAKKAARFKRHRERLETLELALAQAEHDRLVGQQREAQEKQAGLRDVLEQDGAGLAKQEAAHEALRTRHIEREQLLVTAQTRLSAHVEKLRAAQSDLRLAEERKAVTVRDIARLTEEQEVELQRAEMLAESLSNIQSSVTGAEPAAESAESALDVARGKRDTVVAAVESQRRRVHSARQEEKSASDALSELRRTLDRSSSRVEMIQEELNTLDTKEGALRDQANETSRLAADSADALEVAEAAVASAKKASEDAVARRDQAQEEVQALQTLVHEAERRMDASRAEVGLLDSLLASFDDFSESIQFLAGNREWTDEELVTVADLISCPPEIKAAVESALGEFAACLVVRSEMEAARAIGQLRDSEKGRATFVVLDRLPAAPAPVLAPAGAAALLDLVRVEPEHAGLAATLLHDTLLVDTLDDALALSGPGLRVFSKSGEWVHNGGVVYGGAERTSASGAGRLGRREQLEGARDQLSTATLEAEALQARLSTAQAGLVAIPVSDLERAYRESLGQLNQAQRSQARAAMESDQVKRRLEEIARRREELSTSLAGYRADIESRGEAVQDAQTRVATSEKSRTELELAFQALEIDGRRAIGAYSEAKVAAVQARNQLDNLNRDLARVEEELVRLEQQKLNRVKRLVELNGRLEEVAQRIATLAEMIDGLERDRANIDRDVLAARDSLSEIKVQISDLELTLRQLRRTRELRIQEENALSVRLADLEARTETLIASSLEDYEVDLTSVRIDPPEDFDLETARRDVQELRAKIRGLGPVNELALETFEEEQERLLFMEAQLKDLESAEATLMETISEINTTASQRFEETFSAIQANFSRLFEHLFGEDASARVVLQNPDDPLESDVEVFARPRGKKPSVLAQLSGGEKTLTAIALLFSIYLVKPSPFCILDEVDAPLDDANVDRFMDLIRTFSETTQFVLVTHNKRTMESADRMYGITMQQQGVSSLVGVEFGSEMQMVA